MSKRKVINMGKYDLSRWYRQEVKIVDSDYMDVIHTRMVKNAFSLPGFSDPIEKHEISYDAFSQNLEPIYFWIIDYINQYYKGSEKLVDNFLSSAGSGHFTDLQTKGTRMQEEAMKMLGSANQIIKSILNIIYDLKEFKLRLAQYKDYHSDDKSIRNAALLSLKQIWLDKVDIQRGNSSIKALGVAGANQPNFVTLIDAFMTANSLKDVKDLDLNDRVKRILEQRIQEFLNWLETSEIDLTKRFNIEKKYLLSQVNTVKLYARWIKPYLKASRQLEQHASPTSAIVNTFNTAIFELMIYGFRDYDPEPDIQEGELPKSFKKIKARKYTGIVIVEFKFRSAPDRADQRGGYGYRGRADIVFTSYSLNEDEISVLKDEIEKDDIGDIYSLIEGTTSESIAEIQEDIDEFLSDKNTNKDDSDSSKDDSNPFSALFSFLKKDKDKSKQTKSKIIRKDSDNEKVLRSQAILDARWQCRKLYNAFKKSYQMPAFPPVS